MFLSVLNNIFEKKKVLPYLVHRVISTSNPLTADKREINAYEIEMKNVSETKSGSQMPPTIQPFFNSFIQQICSYSPCLIPGTRDILVDKNRSSFCLVELIKLSGEERS